MAAASRRDFRAEWDAELAIDPSMRRASGAVAEVPAAFHRKLREGAVTPAVFKALQGQFVHEVDEGSGSSRIRPPLC